jgi:serine/threonine protein kinase
MALEPAKLSDFHVAGALGTGTTARVYEAVHLATGRPVAIKTLEPSQSGTAMRERFAREALILAGVQSRHVGQILGFGFDQGQPFLVLERLDGETLDAKLRRDGPIPPPVAVRWIEQLLLGVRDCHDAKVIHRDIKPANIFLHREGAHENVKLIDFGVARLREITGDAPALTETNHLIGSMGYMAPEQLQNPKSVSYPADLYAVGVVVYRSLTGRLPFVSRSLAAVIRMKTELPPPAIVELPGRRNDPLLDWFTQKALARDAGDRFQSAREMLEHWWSVMARLDDDDDDTEVRGTPGPISASARQSPGIYDDEHEDESTIRRPRISIGPWTLGQTAPETVRDAGPLTMPAPAPAPAEPYDIPTRTNPSLQQLVEEELELSRKGRGKG